MTSTAPRSGVARPAGTTGPAATRRYGPAVAEPPPAWAVGLTLVVTALFAHYVRPVSLGPFAPPRPLALAVYGACVVGELAVIAVGLRVLAAAGHSGLEPSLIAAVVGLHFLPFAWAFRERMFLVLGGAVAGIGAVGMLVGALGVSRAADAAAVVAGLVMLAIIALYAQGRFAPPVADRPAQPRLS